MDDRLHRTSWEESYQRGENFIFFPKEEVVKFLNRFVRKRISPSEYRDILAAEGPLRGIDLGCGIGRQTVLMEEFGIEGYGADISDTAIARARELAAWMGFEKTAQRFSVIRNLPLSYSDGFFHLGLCESVLDSMYFEEARRVLIELQRLVSRILFVSLISGDGHEGYREFAGDVVVDAPHEKGTIQSYYNYSRIEKLLSGTRWGVKWLRLMTEESLTSRYKYGRYYMVLEKQ